MVRKLFKKATDYAKQNPEQTKRYAKKAFDTIKNKQKSSSSKQPKK
ncbi:hypothetical protein [Halobacillus naozhouensis]|uniref:Uncharacterized protein n=1 Tax=Halobacillus naozhouensis TaxID=554880 RepID=A0ABY8ITZ5_9BACI|nr:hypothetical protein [Halobacillus naozhouensis]WFT73548.1 hypothetical protein P9989_14315 [Halobacillus naozhouensis]